MDELHPPIATPWQRIQDIRIKYKGAEYPLVIFQRVVQGCMIEVA